jgi:hypothetical protein
MPKKSDSALRERRIGVGHESVRRWVLQADGDEPTRDRVTSAEHAEIKELKAENTRVREDAALLRAATIFFVRQLDSATDDVGLIDTMRSEGHAVESICWVLRGQGCQIAARTYLAWRVRHVATRRVADARVLDAVCDTA